MTEREQWAEEQVIGLVNAGVDLVDAQATVARVLAAMPEDADPDTWLPDLDATLTDADVVDARADWYASDAVPPKFKRLLDAVGE
jgi:hypothetical protein